MNEERRNPRFGKPRFKEESPGDAGRIKKIIEEVEEKLKESLKPESLDGLNSFERKLVHRHFDHNKEFETRTYRNEGRFTLCVYPVENIKKFAKDKAEKMLETGVETEDLAPMGSYERYIVHAALQDIDGVETSSHGEGPDRHVQISSNKFGRGLKRIVRKIKLF